MPFSFDEEARNGAVFRRLDPKSDRGAAIGADEHGFRIGHPDGTLHILVERTGNGAAHAAGRCGDKDLVHVFAFAVAGEPVCNGTPIGGELRLRFIFRSACQRAQLPSGRVQDLDGALIAVARVRCSRLRDGDGFAVRRPGERRGRRARRQRDGHAPGAGSEAVRFAAVGGDDPHMRRHWLSRD